MDDTLLKYDQSLEALEKQRENLELVMKKMGAEWEESGAGVGWMGDIMYSNSSTTSMGKSPPPPLLLPSITSSSSEPSHDYLQTLLNVNDQLLAESLACSSIDTTNTQSSFIKKSPFVTPSPSQSQDDTLVAQFTPPITPD
ncbi:uncharacterized protein EV154DRAFT_550033 [Mucor mucedo]|uniref:Uncharacterized protein n=1 Tax=Mucor saturninus TaxID=64648 RepID=A0A8H7RDK3_9FUNG|nr:uncharacterized protein EV154DRAFT_550033 [Mucor mucedo]KAG2209216.1 hypothetical protein INT47_005508 [Mucor saturninus]KAI7893249.1 hypothetical protein EV154DRAFT_550033 [Mucor mucedo]